MRERWRNLLRPTSDDPQTARQQTLLNWILVGLSVLSILTGTTTLVLWLTGQIDPVATIASFGLIPFLVLSYLLGRRGSVRIAGYIPTILVFALLAASMLLMGIGHISTVGLALVVITASVMINTAAGIFYAILSVAAYAFAGWALTTGLVPAPFMPQSIIIFDAVGLGVFLALFLLMIWLSNREIVRALEREQRVSGQLQAQSRELEDLVASRTRGLERRATQLQTASEIAKMASEAGEAQALMSQAIELIRARFGYYHASIFMLDETGNWAQLEASTGEAGRKMLARKHRLATGSASIIGWVMANRLPRIALDVDQDPFHFKNPLLPDTRAEMAVPLMVGKRLLGALDVQSTEPHAFGEDDVRTLEAIASELAVAIDSARIQREMQRQLERIEVAYRQQIQDGWQRVSRSGRLPIIHLDQHGELMPSTEEDFPLIEDALSQGGTVLSQDQRELAIPIEVRGEIIATLAARRPRLAEPWSEDEIALIEAIAAQSALALENARQRAEEQRRVTELEVINRISQAVSQMLRLDTLYRIVHRQINQVLGESEMLVVLFNPADETIRIPYASGDTSQADQSIPLGEDLTSLVLRSRQPLLLAENLIQQAEILGVQDLDTEAKSWLGVPMLLGDQILGAIIVEDTSVENRFTEDDAALLSTVASQIAAGIQNTRLLDQVQRSARRERLIHEITSKVRRSPDIRSILETTTRELGRALNAVRSTVELGAGNGETEPSASPGSQEGTGGQQA
ncbi:MAG: GAF domain-containing protein [Anaerolineales bacterium]